MWKKKYLWLLAFFGGLTVYGGEVNYYYRKINTVGSLQSLLEGTRNAFELGRVSTFFHTIKTLLIHNAGRMTIGLLAVLLFAAIVIWLIIMSQAAIIRVVGYSRQNKPTGLADGITTGTKKFWPLIQLNVIGLLIGWAAWIILTGVPAAIFMINNQAVWSTAAYIGGILSIVSSIIIIFIIQFATAGIILFDTKAIPALVDAWKLFTRNIISSLEMAIAIFTVNLTAFLVVMAVLVMLINPFTLAGLITIIAAIAVAYAILGAFSFSAWVIYYLKLVAGKTPSKLGEWTNQLANFAGQKRAVD